MNIHNVKCILVNSTTHKVEHVYRDMKDSSSWKDLETTHSHPIFLENSNLIYYFHYNHAGPSMISSPKPEDKGFIWITTNFEKEPEELDDFSTEFIEGYGDGLIVAYKKTKSDYQRGTPVDIDLPLEWIEKRVSEYTDGYNRQVPEFTCMISPKFDEPNDYELLLRVENKERLSWHYDVKFNAPIKQLTSQILTFSLEYNEVTIIVGKIQDLNHQIKVMIIRNDQEDLSQIASITIAAHKAPGWIKSRLESFFREKFFGKKLRDKDAPLRLIET